MMRIDWTVAALVVGVLVAALSVWRAHRLPDVQFNLIDLLMEGGRVSKIACAFMLVLGVSTWVIVHLTINNRLTEGYLTIYTGAWIIPLVTKVVANKAEPTASGGQNG